MPTIGVSDFVRRQTPESRFSHYQGSWEDLATRVMVEFGKATPGYRDGVKLVPVPSEGFFSGVVEVAKETALSARLIQRRPDEEFYVEAFATGSIKKAPAQVVNVVIYRKDVLLEEKDAQITGADWDIISVNASAVENEPMHPIAMMRNFLELTGGTKALYAAEEFARAIHYWSTRVMIDPDLK